MQLHGQYIKSAPAHQRDDLAELAVAHDEVAQRRLGINQQAVGGLAHIMRVQPLLRVALDGGLAHTRGGQLRAACAPINVLSNKVLAEGVEMLYGTEAAPAACSS